VNPIPSFSALQRAENSSMERVPGGQWLREGFQCSSASRKFLNSSRTTSPNVSSSSFQCSSASRKFLNRNLDHASTIFEHRFQCSSASRKFLNYAIAIDVDTHRRFSALQRAENSSIHIAFKICLVSRMFQCSSASRKFLNYLILPSGSPYIVVSVLFSEPKIPQSYNPNTLAVFPFVSVLFSEPKIPQL